MVVILLVKNHLAETHHIFPSLSISGISEQSYKPFFSFFFKEKQTVHACNLFLCHPVNKLERFQLQATHPQFYQKKPILSAVLLG